MYYLLASKKPSFPSAKDRRTTSCSYMEAYPPLLHPFSITHDIHTLRLPTAFSRFLLIHARPQITGTLNPSPPFSLLVCYPDISAPTLPHPQEATLPEPPLM